MCPPININSFLPAGTSQQPISICSANEAMSAKSAFAEPIVAHGLLDAAVEE